MPRTWVECAVQVMKESLDKSKLWTVVEILQVISKKNLKRVSGRTSYLALFSALMDDIQKPTGFFERRDGKFTLKMQTLTETLEVICIANEGEENANVVFESDKDTPIRTLEPHKRLDFTSSESRLCSTQRDIPGSSLNLPIDLTSDDTSITSTHIPTEEHVSDTEYPFPAKITELQKQMRKLKREAQVKMWRAREEREAREIRAQLRRQRIEVSEPPLLQSNPAKTRVNFALNANQIFEYSP